MNIIKRFVIGRDEPCPCGSGIKYKNCCFARNDKSIDDKHLQKLMLDISRNFDSCKFEVCLHPNQAECKLPIKHAHSIQNHGVLSQISEKNHVMAYRTDKTENIDAKKIDDKTINIQLKMSRVGVNDATTQTCFCNYHDSKVFAPIESNPNGFQANDLEQLFIYAYKAFAFEYYKTQVAMTALQNLFKAIPQKLKRYPFLFVPNYREHQMKQAEMEYYKNFFDAGLLNHSYLGLVTKVIKIPHKIAFATTECISPSFNLKGKRIPKMAKKQMRRIFVSVFPDNTSSYILFSYLEADKSCFEEYINQMLGLEQSDLLNYLSILLPLYSENLVLSPKLWRKWGKEGQEVFYSLLNMIDKRLILAEARMCRRIYMFQKNDIPLPPCTCDLFEEI